MPRLDIRPTTYDEVADTATHLFAEHWQEIARNKAVMVLKPDAARYRALEAGGMFFALAAFIDDELVGYSGNFISSHLHYADLRYATNDVLFVSEAHRKSSLGLKLIRETEREARRRGAKILLWHAKANTPMVEMMPKLKYGTQDIVFSKELAASHFQLIDRGLGVDAACAELQTQSHLWDENKVRQRAKGSPHRDTRSIFLREPATPGLRSMFTELVCTDCQIIEYLPAVADLARHAISRIGNVELGRVMLAELAPGGRIDRHSDHGDYAAHYDRFHLVLQSDEGNEFTVEDETIHMQQGELWTFSHRVPHEVRNNSTRPRVHLIIDAVRS